MGDARVGVKVVELQAFWVNGTQIGVAIGLPLVIALLFSGGWRIVFWAYSAGSVVILLPMLLGWLRMSRADRDT